MPVTINRFDTIISFLYDEGIKSGETEEVKRMRKLTQIEKNRIRLVNELSACFRRSFPGLKRDKRFAPIRLEKYEKKG